MKKTLLIVSGGIEALPGIKLAQEMGLFVVVSDINPNAPGFNIANDKLIASTYDVDATVKAALLYNQTVRKIDGVICIASDVPLTVASVAKALDLPGISIESAKLAMDKLKMKEQFSRDGVPVPWFSKVENCDHLREIIKVKGLPLVLKPIDSRGARGVLQLTEKLQLTGDIITQLSDLFELSKSFSPTGTVMVERFLKGPQVSTESIVIDGVAYTPGFSDRNYEYLEKYAPHIIENGGELPSRLSQEQQQAILDLIQKAAKSMGISNGVVKGDIVVNSGVVKGDSGDIFLNSGVVKGNSGDIFLNNGVRKSDSGNSVLNNGVINNGEHVVGKPYVIELAARLSGGYFCSHEIPLNTGVNFVGCAIRMALGQKPDPSELKPQFQRGVVQRYIFPEPGRVVDISGLKEVMDSPDIALCEIRVKKGDIVTKTDSHPARAGVIITCCKTREEALLKADAAVATIKISTVK